MSCPRTWTKRLHGSSSSPWATDSTSSLPNRSTTLPPGRKAPNSHLLCPLLDRVIFVGASAAPGAPAYLRTFFLMDQRRCGTSALTLSIRHNCAVPPTATFASCICGSATLQPRMDRLALSLRANPSALEFASWHAAPGVLHPRTG